jgi:hypothetical protein
MTKRESHSYLHRFDISRWYFCEHVYKPSGSAKARHFLTSCSKSYITQMALGCSCIMYDFENGKLSLHWLRVTLREPLHKELREYFEFGTQQAHLVAVKESIGLQLQYRRVVIWEEIYKSRSCLFYFIIYRRRVDWKGYVYMKSWREMSQKHSFCLHETFGFRGPLLRIWTLEGYVARLLL